MSQSLSQLYIHVIFHVKDYTTTIRKEDETDLYAYLGGIIRQTGSTSIIINGRGDHVHILARLSKNISVSSFVNDLKSGSSFWIKQNKKGYTHFAWQKGYAGFSVSQSRLNAVIQYIRNQEEHHRKATFREEYVRFLKEYGIEYNEDFLWT